MKGLIATVAIVAAAAFPAGAAAAGPQRKLDNAQERWSDLGIRDYHFTLEAYRFRNADDPYKLTVRNGRPVNPPDEVRTVASVVRLHRRIQQAIDDGYADVDVTYGKRGLPRTVYLNVSDEIVDEEVRYVARGLQVDD